MSLPKNYIIFYIHYQTNFG